MFFLAKILNQVQHDMPGGIGNIRRTQ